MRSATLRSSVFPLVLIGGLFVFHSIAGLTGWYWTIPAVSSVMHVVGGFVVAGVFASIFFRRGHTLTLQRVVSIVLIVGILWELFELFLDSGMLFATVLPSQLGWGDASMDLFLDLLGGFVFWRIYLYQKQMLPVHLPQTLATEGEGE